MSPRRKKTKTRPDSNETLAIPEPPSDHLTDPTLHPDLAAQSSLKMDPSMLHPDLAAQSQHDLQDMVPIKPKKRKNAAETSTAAIIAAHQDHTDESTVSVDAAAEFLRTIQERESQKNLLSLSAENTPIVPNELPDLSTLQTFTIPMQASYQGYPSATQFNSMLDEYLGGLSPKKQTKALLTQQMYDDILTVLLTPTETKVGSAQFRFWAKKMFKLVSTQVAHIVIHENKPVAVKEQLYDVLVQCHGQANHGGRDKTAAQVSHFNDLLNDRFESFIRGYQRNLLRDLSRGVLIVCAIRV